MRSSPRWRGRTGSPVRKLGVLTALLLAGCGGAQDEEAREVGGLPAAAPSTDLGAPVIEGLMGPGAAPIARDTIDLRQIGYSLGAPDAPVRVYEFSDFGCPFCGMFAQGTFLDLQREFIETGRVHWTYVPIVMGIFPNGEEAARAAECAAEQDAFWEMHDLLYTNQSEWKSTRDAAALFAGLASEAGLAEEPFASCYREDRGGARTQLNNRAAAGLGVRATPSFFINGRLVEGALPIQQFRAVLTRLSSEG